MVESEIFLTKNQELSTRCAISDKNILRVVWRWLVMGFSRPCLSSHFNLSNSFFNLSIIFHFMSQLSQLLIISTSSQPFLENSSEKFSELSLPVLLLPGDGSRDQETVGRSPRAHLAPATRQGQAQRRRQRSLGLEWQRRTGSWINLCGKCNCNCNKSFTNCN